VVVQVVGSFLLPRSIAILKYVVGMPPRRNHKSKPRDMHWLVGWLVAANYEPARPRRSTQKGQRSMRNLKQEDLQNVSCDARLLLPAASNDVIVDKIDYRWDLLQHATLPVLGMCDVGN
jgi:hypothetical protein